MFLSKTWSQPPLLVVHSLTPQPCGSLLIIDLISFILNLLGFIERNFLQRHFFTCSGSSSQPPQLFAPSQTCLQICLSRKPLGTFASSVSNVKPSLLEWHLPRFFFHYHTHSIAYHNQSILEHSIFTWAADTSCHPQSSQSQLWCCNRRQTVLSKYISKMMFKKVSKVVLATNLRNENRSQK